MSAWIEAGPECLVWEELNVRFACSEPHHPLDWIGLYPAHTPTVVGVSHHRWLYLSAASTDSHGQRSITFPTNMLPTYAGRFELRMHRANGYGPAVATCKVTFREGKRSPWKSALMFGGLLLTVQGFQWTLDAKGNCDADPIDTAGATDPIGDHMSRWAADANHYLVHNLDVAGALQALCSSALDGSMIALFVVGAFQRSSLRPFLALFLLQVFRFVAQAAAVMPCAPGFIWPRGTLLGLDVPTLFVDYHPANDYFFSGHTGTVVVAGLEFMEMDHYRTGWRTW